MANFIEEFYYGNLDPQARSTKQNKMVQKQMEVLAICCPIISGFIVGAFPSVPKEEKFSRLDSTIGKLFSLSFGLMLYGGLLGILVYDDPLTPPLLSCVGLVIGGSTLGYIGFRMFFGK